MHAKYKGKLAMQSKVPLLTKKDLSLAYTPGVAQPCLEIAQDPSKVYDYTSKGNLVAVVSDGTSVLGLGDIGPYAAMPVMEGKAVLFKHFADIDAFPICLDTKDPDEIVNIVKKLSPTFGGILLEDISAPRCFEVEDRLKRELNIPVFHDDQHGTAVVVVAALINSLKLAGKTFAGVRVVINGAGAAGMAVAKLLQFFNVGDIILCDTTGTIYRGREENMSSLKQQMAMTTNSAQVNGTLADALVGADVFVGVSKPNVVSRDMVRAMAKNPILLPLANPIPEIMPDEAKKAGALVVCTGRSDFPNQVNNVLAFPGIFRGALDVRAREINEPMKVAAAEAIAALISDDQVTSEYVIAGIFDPRVLKAVSSAVEAAAIRTGASTKKKEGNGRQGAVGKAR